MWAVVRGQAGFALKMAYFFCDPSVRMISLLQLRVTP
jgi:hypothetical protein